MVHASGQLIALWLWPSPVAETRARPLPPLPLPPLPPPARPTRRFQASITITRTPLRCTHAGDAARARRRLRRGGPAENGNRCDARALPRPDLATPAAPHTCQRGQGKCGVPRPAPRVGRPDGSWRPSCRSARHRSYTADDGLGNAHARACRAGSAPQLTPSCRVWSRTGRAAADQPSLLCTQSDTNWYWNGGGRHPLVSLGESVRWAGCTKGGLPSRQTHACNNAAHEWHAQPVGIFRRSKCTKRRLAGPLHAHARRVHGGTYGMRMRDMCMVGPAACAWRHVHARHVHGGTCGMRMAACA
eukprot:360679-Chlamydomonas_euryale.AAC.4